MRLIDADALLDDIKQLMRSPWATCGTPVEIAIKRDAMCFVRDLCVRDAHTVDAEPVVHAYWMDDAYCSNCRAARARPWAGYLEHNANTFCHVCGAKMYGGAANG